MQNFFVQFFRKYIYNALEMLNYSLEKALKTTKSHILKLNKLGLATVEDLLKFYPRALESTEILTKMSQIELKKKNTLEGTLHYLEIETTRSRKKIAKALFTLEDGTDLEVVWFHIPYILKRLNLPRKIFLVGKVDRRYGELQISNPEIHTDINIHIGGIRPIYPESPPITSKWLREKISGCLNFLSSVKDPVPEKIRKTENMISKIKAMRDIHFPETSQDWQIAKNRLGFEEIFEIQLRVMKAKIEREASHENLHKAIFNAQQVKKDLKKIPFELTFDQKKTLWEILQDFEKDRQMARLLQGDVGSGKTIVGFMAALQMVRAGFQVAILAPTEILATQHYESAQKFLGVYEAFKDKDEFPGTLLEVEGLTEKTSSIELLTGSVTTKNKKIIKHDLKTGKIKLLIGTHAILTEDTIFNNLGFAIVDEQHRFGVKQRNILVENKAHILSMTATPIPRSLALTLYGDQDISIIKEKPAGRKEIITRILSDTQTETQCYRFIEDQIGKGRQIFWVCPLVDESEKIEAKSVKEEFVNITNLFPNQKVGLLYGKMRPKEKAQIMQDFKDKKFDILVSTSVIEVGVDIPNATVMVIENSERFGLAQLHQFRGRIGRNNMQSYCFLKIGKPDHKNKERLKAMEKSNDGFYLSEVDLKLRGSGEVYGLKQSGLPDLKCVDMGNIELIQNARFWAESILREDISLKKYPLLKKVIEETAVYF